ncbi:MAG TPA: hypothetical protein VL860_10290 [Planctomycetota bacterium]|nr:hypothetical protein [Planctomycetota bacterium]
MDKIEVAGYSAAVVCLLATVAVFFLWIAPSNTKIKTNLAGIQDASKKLHAYSTDWDTLKNIPPEQAPKSVAEIEKLLDKVVVTDAIKKLAKDDRTFIGGQSRTLIKSVVAAHEVAAPVPSKDKLHDLLALRADLEKLFADNKVPFPDSAKSLGLPERTEVTISDYQFASATLCKDVMTALFKPSTKITIKRGIADGESINVIDKTLEEKVNFVQQFFYYDETGWAAKQKVADAEIQRVGHPRGTSGHDAPVPDTTHPLPCKRTGFRLVFQTLPAHVNAALAGLENLNGNLVTIKRFEVVRASSAYFKKAEFNGERMEVPQPYRDGNVQVTVDVELVAFNANPKASEELGKALWADKGN